MHVSLLKCLRSPTGKAAVELCGAQGFWNTSDAQALPEHLLGSHGGTRCANTGLAGPQPPAGDWIRYPLTQIPPILEGMRGRDSGPVAP